MYTEKEKEVGTLQDISSPEDSNIHGGNYDSEVRKKQTLECDREWQLLELETRMQLRVKHS